MRCDLDILVDYQFTLIIESWLGVTWWVIATLHAKRNFRATQGHSRYIETNLYAGERYRWLIELSEPHHGLLYRERNKLPRVPSSQLCHVHPHQSILNQSSGI